MFIGDKILVCDRVYFARLLHYGEQAVKREAINPWPRELDGMMSQGGGAKPLSGVPFRETDILKLLHQGFEEVGIVVYNGSNCIQTMYYCRT